MSAALAKSAKDTDIVFGEMKSLFVFAVRFNVEPAFVQNGYHFRLVEKSRVSGS
jgi:hypothetical protein